MAKSENNEVMFGARGKVGNLVVFKNYYGETVISKRGRKRKPLNTSEEQMLVKERFKEGVIYAKGVLQDPILAGFYQPYVKGGVRIYNLALADFCKPPEIKNINTGQYAGAIGDQLIIRVIDNFKVQSVMVTISAPDGTVLETGTAVQTANQADWLYTATVLNGNPDGTFITAKAADTPGNVTTFTCQIFRS